MEDKDVIAIYAIIASFVIGGLTMAFSLINSRKTRYINAITSARIKYIQDVRGAVSEYCGLFYRYKVLHEHHPGISNEKLEVLRSIDKLKYQIMLYLNPDDELWDQPIMQMVTALRENIDQDNEERIRELILITQYLFKLEWEGAKRESRRGLSWNTEREVFRTQMHQQYLSQKKVQSKQT